VRIPWISRTGTLTLALLLTAAPGLAAEQILIDGSTGVMPLVAALAEAYQERQPGVTVEIGKGLGTKARLEALAAGAIGMTTMTVVEQSQGRIRPLSLNGIAPRAENVKSQSYSLTRDSFLVTKATPTPAVARFLDFIRSPEGAKVIAANGAVPVK
jgi:phosphate transport system substrate-binding protein